MTTTTDTTDIQSRREVMRAFLPSSPLVRHLGIELCELGDDRAELRLPYDPRLATIGDVVHGGTIASLIDTAGMAATWACDERPDSLRGSTISMTVDYLAAAVGKDLFATAFVVRRGSSLVFSEVAVAEPDGRLVARGSVIQRLG